MTGRPALNTRLYPGLPSFATIMLWALGSVMRLERAYFFWRDADVEGEEVGGEGGGAKGRGREGRAKRTSTNIFSQPRLSKRREAVTSKRCC